MFIPLSAYDISRRKLYPLAIPAAAALITHAVDGKYSLVVMVTAFCGAAVMIEMLSRRSQELANKLIVTRDDAVEFSNELIRKNEQIIEAQDNEVHLAMLKERNRIAREIHDNVGHMLTRTILQTGALQIINKDENLKEPLESIKNTLDDAMNQVRKSVHDLHDESVDLERSLREAISPLSEKFTVTFEYDISENINRNIKYCFIALVKEAVNNIIKHSNGDRALITAREHPGMYTLLVQDNGVCKDIPVNSDGGIGLTNMRDRVSALNGNINISSGRDGFKVFASIMK
jgi:signal transduction histidine kinase